MFSAHLLSPFGFDLPFSCRMLVRRAAVFGAGGGALLASAAVPAGAEDLLPVEAPAAVADFRLTPSAAPRPDYPFASATFSPLAPPGDPVAASSTGETPGASLPGLAPGGDAAVPPAPPLVGPPDSGGAGAAPGAVPASARSYRSFGRQVGAVKWEMAAILGYYTAINGTKLFQDPTWPHGHSEGWFGTGTNNVGVDKLAHAYSSYVISELLHARLRRKTGDAPGIAVTAAALASATMLYTEFWDSIERSAGWSWEDVAFNSMGAGFSLLRNSVPGLDRKLDYRLMIVPNGNILNTKGKAHFEQQRYFFALKLSGFRAFEQGPLRLLELHAGYYGKDFSNQDHAMGIRPQRRLYVGVGINLRQLFFRNPRSRVGRAVADGLDYFQPPYTEAILPLTR